MPRLIVRRGDLERYEVLYKTFGSRILVVWDRRRADRRRQPESRNGDERRQGERRGTSPASWKALGFVVSD